MYRASANRSRASRMQPYTPPITIAHDSAELKLPRSKMLCV